MVTATLKLFFDWIKSCLNKGPIPSGTLRYFCGCGKAQLVKVPTSRERAFPCRSSSPCEGEAVHVAPARFPYRVARGEQCGACRAHVVDEQDAFRRARARQGGYGMRHVPHTRAARECALVVGARRGKQGDDGPPDYERHLLREQLRVVEPSACPGLARGGDERDPCHFACDLGGEVACHVARHLRCKSLLAPVLVDNSDAPRALGKFEGACEARERHGFSSRCGKHHGVALSALCMPPGSAADGACTPKVDEGEFASAAFA